jgi:ubiquinone/menaquinone biosynthesis C-methylase UbiE
MSSKYAETLPVDRPLPAEAKKFDELYFDLRSREKRMYTDEEVAQLPHIDRTHVHYREWLTRAASAERLVARLKKKNRDLTILEIGCGNGWLCNKLAVSLNCEVTGVDTHLQELQQAARVFARVANLAFMPGNASHFHFTTTFDIIVFAASIQYFPSLGSILDKSISLLNAGGEIHIIDSNFYAASAIDGAQQRSADYFREQGFGEMRRHYHHHTWDTVREFRHEILYQPNSLLNRLRRNNQPFPWVLIQSRK